VAAGPEVTPDEPDTDGDGDGDGDGDEGAEAGRRWSGAFTTVCALVALAASGVGLFWDFYPQYRPDPLDSVGADVAVVALEPKVSLIEWLRRAHGREAAADAQKIFGDTPSASELHQPGELIYVRTQVDGHKHHEVSLEYHLYNSSTQQRVELPLPPDLAKVQSIRLDAPSQRSVQLLWTPDLSAERHAFLRVELRSEHGLLAVADSGLIVKGRMGH
jgi:hypothetical protein